MGGGTALFPPPRPLVILPLREADCRGCHAVPSGQPHPRASVTRQAQAGAALDGQPAPSRHRRLPRGHEAGVGLWRFATFPALRPIELSLALRTRCLVIKGVVVPRPPSPERLSPPPQPSRRTRNTARSPDLSSSIKLAVPPGHHPSRALLVQGSLTTSAVGVPAARQASAAARAPTERRRFGTFRPSAPCLEEHVMNLPR